MPDSVQSSAVVVPTSNGEAKPAEAAAVTKMSGGGLLLSPLPLNEGRRKTRRLSKKAIKMLKKMSKAKLAKLMKGGVGEGFESTETEGAARKTRKGKKGSRKHGFLY